MAFFGVTLETIDNVWTHPNAERLELASLKGMCFQFVVGKGSIKSGDKVLYFPVDSVLPDDILKKTGFEGKLSGQGKNRVKTVKLRDQISQGLVVKPETILSEYTGELTCDAITSYLGITKYEPEAKVSTDGILLPLPDGLGKYDIEGADRYPDVVERLMDQPVFVTEKLEGTNISVAAIKGTLYVNQRNFTICEKEGKENIYWKVARDSGLLNQVADLSMWAHEDYALYGELCGPGIQSNIYHLKSPKIYVFDIKVGGQWLPPEQFKNVCGVCEKCITPVPELSYGKTLREVLASKTVQEYSNGTSVLADRGVKDVLREGVVIKPLEENYLSNFGRLFIKQRSPLYLSKSDN